MSSSQITILTRETLPVTPPLPPDPNASAPMFKDINYVLPEAITIPEQAVIWTQSTLIDPTLPAQTLSALSFKVLRCVPVTVDKADRVLAIIRAFCHKIAEADMAGGRYPGLGGDEAPWPANTGVVVVVAKDDGAQSPSQSR